MLTIDFVLCTLGRFDIVVKAIESIAQSFSSCSQLREGRLIIVDQNSEDTLTAALNQIILPQGLVIEHLRVNFKGLSRARNFAKQYLRSDLVAFPDDDCEYDISVLGFVVDKFLNNKDLDFISVGTKDKITGNSLLPNITKKTPISITNIVGCSFTFFFRRDDVFLLCDFKSCLGVGSGTRYGASEEEDFIIQLLGKGSLGAGFPDVVIYHEAKEDLLSLETLNRLRSYAGGKAFVLLENYSSFGSKLIFVEIIKPMIKVFRIKGLHFFLRNLFYAYGFYSALVILQSHRIRSKLCA